MYLFALDGVMRSFAQGVESAREQMTFRNVKPTFEAWGFPKNDQGKYLVDTRDHDKMTQVGMRLKEVEPINSRVRAVAAFFCHVRLPLISRLCDAFFRSKGINLVMTCLRDIRVENKFHTEFLFNTTMEGRKHPTFYISERSATLIRDPETNGVGGAAF